jgi:[amino group carrier protein]-lysine/ornithine hydrolase
VSGKPISPAEFLTHLVEIDSVSGRERDVASFLVATMAAAGFDARVDEAGNAVGVREGPPGGEPRELMLLGHMDTVPGRVPVRVEGDLLFGRGSVDAKGPLATFVAASAEAVLPPGARLVVVGAVEEETTSRGARFLVDRYLPSACVIGEPSGWDAVTLGYKGRLLADYRLTRPVAHTAGPRGGVAEDAVAWWRAVTERVDALNANRSGAFDTLQHALRTIRTSSDGFEDVVEATIGFRLPPWAKPEGIATLVEAVRGEAEITVRGGERAYCSTVRTPLAPPFLRAIRGAGGVPRFKNKTGTSDMNIVGPAWGCPIVAYGPGDSSLDHTPNEHVSIAEYLRAIGVLGSVIEEFFGGGTTRIGGDNGTGSFLDNRLHSA